MSRPGPLQELPHPLNPNLNKRPLSPSTSPGHPALPPKRRALDATLHYATVLAGPDSPARVLDFSGVKQQPRRAADRDVPGTPRPRAQASSDLAASPELNPPSTRAMPPPPVPAFALSGPSSRPPHSRGLPPHPLFFEKHPRELPPLTDPQSEHYPGFNVHRDPHTFVTRYDETRAMEDDLADPDAEPDKENDVPPREIRKLTSLFADFHTKSATTPSPVKGKQRMTADTLPIFPVNQKKIFGNGFADDAIDLSSSYGFYRPSPLSDDSDPDLPSWHTHGGGGNGLLG
ncbi:hypothetical protein MD484_g4002, partial [Candolleomyces efflorescens]